MVDHLQSLGGGISLDDLAAVQPIWEEPVSASFAGLDIHVPPPPAESFQFLMTLRILAEAGCELSDVVKSMVWLKNREDFGGFNSVYAEYFPEEPPARSALVSDFLIDILVEIECTAYRPV